VNTLRVGIDGKSLLPPRTGVGRYLAGLLGGLEELALEDLAVEVLRPPAPRSTVLWTLWDLQAASRRGFSVLHLPFYYGPWAPRCPTVLVVHDLLVLEHPEWFRPARLHPIRLLLPASARRAAAVVTFATAVAEAIAERLHLEPSRLRVIPHGVDRHLFRVPGADEIAAVVARWGLSRPYLACLGAVEPRRGVDLAVAAVHALRQVWGELELVLVGPLRAPVPCLKAAPPWVRRLGHVADEELGPLVAGAAAVLAPSRAEGFDLPVLEALACGALVVASDIPPHREHFAGGVQFFSSGDAESLTAATRRVLEDSSLAASLRASGLELASRFRWCDSARAHVAVWREVGG